MNALCFVPNAKRLSGRQTFENIRKSSRNCYIESLRYGVICCGRKEKLTKHIVVIIFISVNVIYI